jgi:hypothetical protein
MEYAGVEEKTFCGVYESTAHIRGLSFIRKQTTLAWSVFYSFKGRQLDHGVHTAIAK